MRGAEFYFYVDRVCNPRLAYSICSHIRHYLGGDAYYNVFHRWPILREIARFSRISSGVTPTNCLTFWDEEAGPEAIDSKAGRWGTRRPALLFVMMATGRER